MRLSQRSLIAVLVGVAAGLVLLGVRQSMIAYAEPDPCVVEEVNEPTSTTLVEETSAETTTSVVPGTTTTMAPEITTTTMAPEITTTTMAPEPTSTTIVEDESVDVGSMSYVEAAESAVSEPEPLAPLVPEPSTTTTELPPSTTIPDTTTTSVVVETTSTLVVADTTTTLVPETTTTVVPDIDCVPSVEILELPGWGQPEGVIQPAVNGGEDDVVVALSEIPVPVPDPSPEESVPPTQPPVIQPEPFRDPDTSKVYTVSATVTVGVGATLEDLDAVTMCWYKPTAPAPIAAGTSACGVLNPQTEFKMVWTEFNEINEGENAGKAGFDKATSEFFPSNLYRKAIPQVETTAEVASFDRAATTMTVRFAFRVSPAMLAGTDWRVVVSATYDTGLDANPEPSVVERQDLSVGYWSEVSTPRDPLEFGIVPPGGQRTLAPVAMGTYRANGPSQLTMTGNDYSCVGCSVPLGLQGSVVSAPEADPGVGRVSLDCRAGELVPVRLNGSGTAVAPLAPSGEAAATLNAVTCTIKYGGGAERALVLYSGPVTVTITPKAN